MNDLHAIAHEFRIKYGCSPFEPTLEQIIDILNRAARIELSQMRKVTELEIAVLVQQVVPSTGMYKYGGLSYQHMRSLLVRAQSILNSYEPK